MRLPISTAANAYELLEDVIAIIQAEPKRLDMGVVIDRVRNPEYSLVPPCGTVGCVAGWIRILRGERTLLSASVGRAYEALIGQRWYGREPGEALISSELYSLFYDSFPHSQPGTSEYVEHVVARIRAFQSRWEPELRARTLEPVDIAAVEAVEYRQAIEKGGAA